jgi:GNAT superfamily N-acetyltransferase
LQVGFLTPEQIAASRMIMGLDTQLIEDGTYYVATVGGELAGCGGWSRRNTLYGGDHSPGRDAALLDPARDAARIRAMYTHPAFARRGVGRLILAVCERAAVAAGFGGGGVSGDQGVRGGAWWGWGAVDFDGEDAVKEIASFLKKRSKKLFDVWGRPKG